MTLDEAIHEFEFDCKIRHLSPKTIDNYRKQLRYFERFLGNEFSTTSVEDVRPSHIKSFLSMMDDAGRKPQYHSIHAEMPKWIRFAPEMMMEMPISVPMVSMIVAGANMPMMPNAISRMPRISAIQSCAAKRRVFMRVRPSPPW